MPRRATDNEAPGAPSARRRILFVAIGLVFWMLVIGGRLAQLQIYRHDELALRARNQQLSSIETAPTRGQVLDRQGRELARSLDTESFYSDPSEVLNVEADGTTEPLEGIFINRRRMEGRTAREITSDQTAFGLGVTSVDFTFGGTTVDRLFYDRK